MYFEIVWLIVLAANLAIWSLICRCDRLRYALDHNIFFPRKLLERPSKQQSWIGDKIKSALLNTLTGDDDDLSGFSPPRAVRTIIAGLLILENVIALSVTGSNDFGKRFSMRCGQLACLNVLPLALLAFPSAGLTLLVRQARPQVLWAHHLFSWIVWYEVLVHSLMEAMVLPSDKFALLVFGFLGLLLLCWTTCSAMEGWRMASHRLAVLGHVPYHAIPGLAGLILIILHSSSTPCRATGGIAILVVLAATLWQANGNSVLLIDVEYHPAIRKSQLLRQDLMHSDKVDLKPGEDCYYYLDGIPHRAMCEVPGTSTCIFLKSGGAGERKVCIEGPYRLPRPPYSSFKDTLGVICAKSGIAEAMSVVRSRALLGHPTDVYWFSDSDELDSFVTDLILKIREISKTNIGLTIFQSQNDTNTLSEEDEQRTTSSDGLHFSNHTWSLY